MDLSKKLIVAICGASGSIYGIRLLEVLLKLPIKVCLIISRAGLQVLEHETDYQGGSFSEFLSGKGVVWHPDALLKLYDADDFFAPPASGSFKHDGMVVAPCSMKTLGAIAAGLADDLILRAADVSLKDKRPLILLPREMPLNMIHLKNMYKVAMAGATIMPPCPSFYFHPKTVSDLIDTVIARVLDHLSIEHELLQQWGEKNFV